MPDLPRVESCCYIDAAKDTIGIGDKNRTDDVWFFRQLLQAHMAKEIEVFTSVLTIAECTHAQGNADERVRGLFERLLMSGQYCVLIQPTPFIAADARDLRWKHGMTLRGADGLHVASALDRKCQEFLTTDRKIMDHAVKINALGMRVLAPSATACLPDRYRQGNMLDDKITPVRRAAGPGKPS